MKSYYDITIGEIDYLIGDSDSNLQMKLDGGLVMKMGEGMVMDLDSGDIHQVMDLRSSIFDDEED